MKIKGLLASAMSGKMAGIVASHNAGGQYFRQFVVPTNPGTVEQQVPRAVMANLTTAWRGLTEIQREAWATFAANSPRIDRLGDTITIAPLAWYVACNSPRVQAGMARIDTAPAEFGYANATAPTIVSITASTDVMSVAFENTDEWAGASGGALLVYTSRPVSPSINFFKGPYRYAGRINGAGTPPTTPQPINLAFPCSVGQKVFVRFRAVQADGRVSSEFRLDGISV